jgi:hypothetical protein
MHKTYSKLKGFDCFKFITSSCFYFICDASFNFGDGFNDGRGDGSLMNEEYEYGDGLGDGIGNTHEFIMVSRIFRLEDA